MVDCTGMTLLTRVKFVLSAKHSCIVNEWAVIMKLTWSFGAFELDRLIRHSWTSVKERSMTIPRPQFTPQQRAFLVTEYARANSVTEVLQHFRRQYPNTRCPARLTVYRNLEKYRNQGTSQNLNKGHSGRPRTGRSRHNIEAFRHRLDEAGQNGERVR